MKAWGERDRLTIKPKCSYTFRVQHVFFRRQYQSIEVIVLNVKMSSEFFADLTFQIWRLECLTSDFHYYNCCFYTFERSLKVKNTLGDPVFGRKFTLTAVKPLGTYSYLTSSRSVRIPSI